jgi:hypothetical protein
MPYKQTGSPQRLSNEPGILDVFYSENVFVNNVNVAVWQEPQSAEAAILGQLASPNFAVDSETILLDGEEDSNFVVQNQRQLIDRGIISQADLDAGDLLPKSFSPGSIDTSSGTTAPTTVSTSTVDLNETEFPDSYQLSPNYTLGRMTKAPGVVFTHPVQASSGLTVAEIVANLELLTKNCVESVKSYRTDMFVTNSFRPGKPGSTSQHPKGMACDMQFSTAKKADYFIIAQWIRDNVPFDQLLLEYKTTGSRLPWIHISFNVNSNRRQIFTFMNDRRYAIGLVDLSNV